MSLGYAEKLSYRDDLGGQLGAPEIFDEAETLAAKAQQLADLVICLTSTEVGCRLGGNATQCCMTICRSKRASRPLSSQELASQQHAASQTSGKAVAAPQQVLSLPSMTSVLAVPSCSLHGSVRVCGGMPILWHQPAMMSDITSCVAGVPTVCGPCSELASPCQKLEAASQQPRPA